MSSAFCSWAGAREAHWVGLLRKVVSPEALDDTVGALAREIAAVPILVMAAIKEIVREAEDI